MFCPAQGFSPLVQIERFLAWSLRAQHPVWSCRNVHVNKWTATRYLDCPVVLINEARFVLSRDKHRASSQGLYSNTDSAAELIRPCVTDLWRSLR